MESKHERERETRLKHETRNARRDTDTHSKHSLSAAAGIVRPQVENPVLLMDVPVYSAEQWQWQWDEGRTHTDERHCDVLALEFPSRNRNAKHKYYLISLKLMLPHSPLTLSPSLSLPSTFLFTAFSLSLTPLTINNN